MAACCGAAGVALCAATVIVVALLVLVIVLGSGRSVVPVACLAQHAWAPAWAAEKQRPTWVDAGEKLLTAKWSPAEGPLVRQG